MCRRATGCTLACLVLVGCGGTESTAIDGGQTPECLANAPNEYRVTILGVGFAAMEGVPVYAATEMGLAFAQATCRAAGSAQVRDAGFELRLTNLTDDAAYPLVRAFGVDLLPATFLFDRKGALVWQRSGAIAVRDTELAAALERVLRKR